jgi:hypothetical protein
VVATDGTVNFADERWLALLRLEEEAAREARLAELAGDDPVTQIDEGEAPPEVPGSTPKASQVANSNGASTPEPTRADPAAGGQKLKLGGLRGGGKPAPVRPPVEAASAPAKPAG